MDGLVAAPDYMTKEGAETLASRVVAFWAKRGRKVSAWAESHADTGGRWFWVVRSDLDLTK